LEVVVQVVQVIGALVILAAFGLAQFGILAQTSRAFLASNLAGAVALALAAYLERQWGFLVLEAAWALVSAAGLLALLRQRRRRPLGRRRVPTAVAARATASAGRRRP
jgi:hypothetical protein